MSSDDPKDPIVEQIRRSSEQKEAEADAAIGERMLTADFQRQADKNGKAELTQIETLFAARCERINEVGSTPDFHYDDQRHMLKAENFALTLHLTGGFSPYRFDMAAELDPDLNFGPGSEPDHTKANWKFLARTDDNGFFWECDGKRYSNEQIVEEGLKALAANLGER